jgi:uncharacterized protein (DUF305 family)
MRLLCLAAALATLAAPALAQTGHPHHAGGSAPHATAQPHAAGSAHPSHGTEAARAYESAMERMHGPMMAGVRDPDPDVAFVKGMIPHHQGAIDMARVVLQHGKDEQTRKWAADVIREQAREIAEMEAWLKARGK